MPAISHSDAISHDQRFPTPQLELDVTHTPRHYDVKGRSTRRGSDVTDRSGRRPRDSTGHTHRFVDVTDRLTSDPAPDTARVELYSRDSWKRRGVQLCTCLGHLSHTRLPSMTYEFRHCPQHPHRTQPPVIPDQFAYPWTVQTYRPTRRVQYGYRQKDITPPSAFTAPPFVMYSSKLPHPHRSHHPPPYTAPLLPPLSPLLSVPLTDRRLRRVDRRKLMVFPPLGPLSETVSQWDGVSQVAPSDDLSPWDSISQVAPPHPFRPTSPRTVAQRPRTQSECPWGSRDREQDGRLAERRGNTAADTPRPRHEVDPPPLARSPARLFKGEYAQPSQ